MTQQRRSYQIGTGLFILLGFAALAYLATQTTSVANFRQGASYTLKARFTNIGQLKLRAPVKIAGVRIGIVSDRAGAATSSMRWSQLSIDKRYNKIPDDSAAAVFTSGLLGDQYVAISPAARPTMLKNGDEFVLTQISMQLEELIGKYLVSGGPSKPGDQQDGEASPTIRNPTPRNPSRSPTDTKHRSHHAAHFRYSRSRL